MEWEVSNWWSRTRAGYTLLGLLQAAAFVTVLPAVLRMYWQDITNFVGGEDALMGWGPILAHAVQFWTFNAAYVCLYALQLPVVEACKVSAKPWPWKGSPAERERFWATVRFSALAVPFNQLLQIPMMFVSVPLMKRMGSMSASLSDWPDTWTICWQLFVSLLVEDAMFYWTHRSLHASSVYPHIHKVHHRFYATVAWSSECAHPVEYIVGNLIPVLMGPLLLRSHLVVFLLFIWLRIAVSIEEHSGYAFPASPVRLLPAGASVEGHDYHHSHNKGMFASQFAFWDWICGTDRAFAAHMKAEAAARGSDELEGDPDTLVKQKGN